MNLCFGLTIVRVGVVGITLTGFHYAKLTKCARINAGRTECSGPLKSWIFTFIVWDMLDKLRLGCFPYKVFCDFCTCGKTRNSQCSYSYAGFIHDLETRHFPCVKMCVSQTRFFLRNWVHCTISQEWNLKLGSM